MAMTYKIKENYLSACIFYFVLQKVYYYWDNLHIISCSYSVIKFQDLNVRGADVAPTSAVCFVSILFLLILTNWKQFNWSALQWHYFRADFHKIYQIVW
jgi:hypothetical protein